MLKIPNFFHHIRGGNWKEKRIVENCNKKDRKVGKSFMKDVSGLIFVNRVAHFTRQAKLRFAKPYFLCFGEGITQRMKNEMNVENCRKYIANNYLKIGKIIILKCQYAVFLLLIEASVRFRVFSYENLKKYMQTKEPFHREVGYNILGEGQQFVDEKNSSTYNDNELPILATNHLLNRVGKSLLFKGGYNHDD